MVNKIVLKRSKHFEKVKNKINVKPHFYLDTVVGFNAACGDPSDKDWKIIASIENSWAYSLVLSIQLTADLNHD